MNQKQLEKLLKRVTDTNDVIAIAHAEIVSLNAEIVNVLLGINTRRANTDDTPQTMQ